MGRIHFGDKWNPHFSFENFLPEVEAEGGTGRESRDAKHWSQHLTSLPSLWHSLQKFTLRFSVLLKSSLLPSPLAFCTGCSHTISSKDWKSSSHNTRGMTIFLPQHTSKGSTAGWCCGAVISYRRNSTLLKSPGVLKNDCVALLESTGFYLSISKLVETAISSLEEIISQTD